MKMADQNRRIAIHFDVDTRELAKLEKAMSTVQSKMNAMSRNIESASKQFNSLSRSVDSINTSQRKYSKAMDQMNRDTQQATSSVKSLQRTVDRGFNSRGINASAQSVRTFDNRIVGARESMKGLNKYAVSFGDSVGIAGERMLAWSLAASGIYGTARAFREVLRTVIELDSHLIDFERLFAGSFRKANEYMDLSSRIAERFSAKLSQVNEVMIEFGKQGLTDKDVARLTEATTLLQTVGDIDVSKATETMSALMKVYEIDTRNAISVVDRLNLVADTSSASVDDLSDALFRSASVANTFGITLDEQIGHITAIQEATRQSGSVIGNSLKTIYSRVTTLPGAFNALADVGVNVFDPMTGDAREVGDIFDELARKWDSLSAKQQQEIGVKVAGTYQLSRFLGLMDNYDRALEHAQTSTNSWGTAQEEADKVTQKLQKNLDLMVKSFQDLARAIGENGLGQALNFAMESVITLTKGLTGIFDTLKGWTFVALGAVGATGMLVSKIKDFNIETKKMAGMTRDASVAQAMRNNLTNEGITVMQHHTNELKRRNGVMGKLKGGVSALALSLRGLGTALLTNPFTWLIGVPALIAGVVGHFKQLEERQKALADTSKTAREQFDAFKDAINTGKVDDYQINALDESLKRLNETQKQLRNEAEKNYRAVNFQKDGYSTLGISVSNARKSKEELIEEYKNSTTVMEHYNEKQQDELAALGLQFNAKTTLMDLERRMGQRIEINTGLLEDSKTAMEEQREKAILPTAEAYYDLGEAIDEQSSAMENALGISNKLMDQMKEQRGIIELLSGVKNKDEVQTKLLENAYSYWADMLGVTEDELKKHPGLMDKQIEKQTKLLELSGKVADGTATTEEKKRAQQLLSAENAEKTAKREANAEKAAQESQREVINKKMQKLQEYDTKMEKAMSSTSGAVFSSSKVIMERMGKQGGEFDRTGTKYDQMKEMIQAGSVQSSSSVAQMSSSTILNLNGVKKKTDDTKSAWEKLKEAFSKKITGFASLSIKGIFSGLFGSGGNIDGDKLKDAVMASGGGSIAGGGYGGLRFTSGFGSRIHPISGKRSFHAGIDLAGPVGTPIRARHGGTVVQAGWAGGYGKMVTIMGTNGLEYRYAHNSSLNVKPGQFVPAGMTIAGMGSTGDSTGSHLHFEVRRGGQAINPTAYYHSGGIVDGKRKPNEVDARLQVGEMVINQSQQKNLFDFLNKKNGNDTFTGMGGPTHTVRYGDTISEIAMKYFGNAYSGGIEKLLKLNPQIKDRNRIYVGQKINVGSSSSSGSSGSKPKPAPKPKPMYKDADAAQKQLDAGLSWIDQMEHLGIRNSDYRVANLTNAKYREAYRMTNQGKEYNKMVFDELSEFTDYNKAKQFFDKADVFLNSTDKARMLKNIMKNIGENVLTEIADNTDKWLDNFNKGVKEANQQVQDMIDLSNQVTNRKIQEKEDNFVSGYVSDMLASLGVAPEVDPRDALQQQADALMDKINQRAEESALLEYRLNSGELQGRLGELSGYRSQLEAQMKAIEDQFKSRGINDQSLISQAQQPLRDRLAEITAEYQELQRAIENGSTTLAENKSELEQLADQYKKLQDELNKVDSKREFTDIWGNVVRDAEGQVKMITDQGQLLMNTYENIRQEIEGIQQAATGGAMSDVISPILAQLKQAVTGFQPQVNAEITTGAADTSSSSETRTYEANSTVVRNVSVNLNVGVALASEGELREFGMKMKDIIEEEVMRGRSGRSPWQ